jgi:hypothetical protein
MISELKKMKKDNEDKNVNDDVQRLRISWLKG